MILSKIKEIPKLLSFAKKSFTKGGFRHVNNYLSGLISLAKKTVRQISVSCADETYSSALNRILIDAKFEKELLEEKYLKKIRYLFRGLDIFLIIDDTLVPHNGENIEESQEHFDHTSNSFVKGHQFFTAILYTPYLQMPIFPELYSKNTNSKISMAEELISKLISAKIQIHTTLFDSWYSDKDLINNCLKSSIKVVCAIKSNRKIKRFKKRKWEPLSLLIQKVRSQKLKELKIDNKTYDIWIEKVKLNKLPFMRLVISHERIENKLQTNPFCLISTNPTENAEDIFKTYKKRWKIETFHRDIKQNLGFAKAFFRKKEGIVRHAILVAIAYAILALFMFQNELKMTIGECCEYLKNKAYKEMVGEIIFLENKKIRIEKFEEVFIS